jgi:hypothetical protein
MSVTDLSDEELERVKNRYLAANKQEGGPFTLREILLEQLRRKPSAFGVVETAKKIIEFAGQSKDGLVTYGDLWKAFRPGVQWKANYSRRVVADALYRVIYYCVRTKLPILTVLVVKGNTRTLSEQAIQHIYDECKVLGVDVGLNPREFVERESVRAHGLVGSNLPDDLQ